MSKSSWIIIIFLFCLFIFSAQTADAALTSGNVTIKKSGGTYPSWAAFWNDLGNLTGDITCTVDADAFTETAAPAAVTENLNGYTLKVTAAAFPTTTDGTTGPIFTWNNTGTFLNMQMEGPGTLIIEGIVYKAGTGFGVGYYFSSIDTAFTAIIRRNVIKGDLTTSNGGIYIYDISPDFKIYNNIIYNTKATIVAGIGIYYYLTLSANSFISNNTIVDCTGTTGAGAGWDSSNASATGLWENNLLYKNKTDFYQINYATGNNNSSYDATADDWATGTNNRINKTASPFGDYANDNFALVAGSDPIGNGKDLSASFTGDFFGNTRTGTWDIGAYEWLPINVTGTVYSDEGSSVLQTGPTVSLAVDGAFYASTTAATSTGAYSFSNVTSSVGNVLTVFLDDSSEKAVTITKSGGINISGLDLFQNRIIVRSEGSGAMTVDDLDKYDYNNDSDILFTADASNDTLTASSTSEFFVWQGKTFSTGGAGGSISLADVDINGTFTATSSQTISVSGNWDATGGTFTSASSTLQFIATSAKTITANNNSFYNLTFNGSGGGWTFQDTNATTTNNFTITNGAVTSASGVLAVGGNWSNSGTFNHNSGTVTFYNSSATSTFSGATTFYNLTSNTASKVLEFTAGASSTTTVSGTLTLNGQACNTMIRLRSTSAGSQWYLNALATTSISYLDVKDSNAAGSVSAVTANNSKDSGNNVNWSISGGTCMITVSGVVYSDEGSTGIGSGKTVRLKVNGLGANYTASTTATSSYSISGVYTLAGDAITVFLDGETEKAVTVTRASSTSGVSDNISGLDLYQNRIIVRHEDSGPITISDLDKYDYEQDLDILFTASSTAGTLTASSTSEFFVWQGKTFQTGGAKGNVSLADVDIRGTFTATSSQTISVSGSWDATSTAVFNAASSNVTLKGTGNFGGSASLTFYNLTFGDGSTGTTTAINTATTTISNTLTIAANQTLNAGSGIWEIKGYSISSSPFIVNGIFNAQTSTFKYTTNQDTNITAATYYNLELIDPPQEQFLTQSQNLEIEPFKIYKEADSETYVFKTLDNDLIEIGTKEHSSPIPYVKLNKWDREASISLSFPTDAQENLQLEGNKVKWVEDKLEAHIYPLEPEVITERDEKGKEHISEINKNGGLEFEIILKEKPATNVISFDIETENLDFFYQPPLTEEIKVGDENGRIVKVTETDAFDKDGNVVNHRPENVVGSYAVYASEQKINWVGGKLYRTGKFGHIFRPKIIDAEGKETWGILNIDKEAGILTVEIPAVFLDTATYPIRHAAGLTFGYETIGATSAYNAQNLVGSLFAGLIGTANSMTFYVVSAITGANIKMALYKHSDSSLVGVTNELLGANMTGSAWNTVDFATGPTINAIEYVLTIFSSYSNRPLIKYDAGDANQGHNAGQTYSNYPNFPNPATFTHTTNKYSIYCTYTARAPIYTLGTTTGQTLTVNNDLTIGNASDTMSVTGATHNPTIDVNGNVSITANATLVAPTSSSFTVAGNWSNSGTFTHSNGTTTFDGSSTSTFSGATTFYNLFIDTNIDGAKIVRFGANATQTISNTLTLKGYSGKTLTIQSTASGTQAILDIAANITSGVDYVNVKDNKVNGQNHTIKAGPNCTNSGNNTNWIFNSSPNTPTSLTQSKSDCSTVISANGWTNETQVCLQGSISDPDASDLVKLQVEVVTSTDSFTNSPSQVASTYCTSTCTSTVSVTGLVQGAQYKWQARSIDDDSATSAWVTSTNYLFGIDTTAPTSVSVTSITENPDTAYQYASSTNIIYYNTATSSGSFIVNATATDTESGIEKLNFPALTNFAVTNGGDDSSSPYAWIYNWTGTSTQDGTASITAFNNAGSTTTASFNVLLDTTAPSGGTITYTDGYYTTTSVAIAYTLGNDTGSGIDSSTGKLQRKEAALSNAFCTSWGSWSDLVTESDGSYTDNSVASGKCYQYQYLVKDNVSNQATYTSANVVKIGGSIKVNFKNEFGTSFTPTGATMSYYCAGGTEQTISNVTTSSHTFVPVAGANCDNNEAITINITNIGNDGYLKYTTTTTWSLTADPNTYNTANKFTLLVSLVFQNGFDTAFDNNTITGQFDPDATVGTINGETKSTNDKIGYPIPTGRAADTYTVVNTSGSNYLKHESANVSIPAFETSSQTQATCQTAARDTTVYLGQRATTLVMQAGASISSMHVYSTYIEYSLVNGSNLTLTSSVRLEMELDPPIAYTFCGLDYSYVTLTSNTTRTVLVTPVRTCSSPGPSFVAPPAVTPVVTPPVKPILPTEEIKKEVKEETIRKETEKEKTEEKPIKELTIEELKAKINEILIKLADLKAQLIQLLQQKIAEIQATINQLKSQLP